MRILVVEDEADLAEILRQALEEEGFAVDVAGEGRSALFNALEWEYDVVVLDLMLPEIDGWEILRRFRAKKKTPVLVLTARDAVVDRVRGLDAGADDYLTKPFELDELIARIRALIRRSGNHPAPVIRVGDVEIHTSARTVTRAGEPVDLTAKEYALLELLALRRGTVVTRTTIYDHIYDEDDDTLSNVVDVYVSNLRRKLGRDFLRTLRGQGYIIDV